MAASWNWENFSLDGFDSEVKDLAATSTSFRILLANLASQHISELEEVRRLAALDRQAANKELERLTAERESLQEQLESLDTLKSRTHQTLSPPSALPVPQLPPVEVQSSPAKSAAGAQWMLEPEQADVQALVVHKDLPREEKTKLLLEAECRLRGEEAEDAEEIAQYKAFGLVLDNSILGRMTRLVLRVEWEMTFGVLILFNVLVMGCQLQFEGLQSGYLLGYPWMTSSAEELWPGGGVAFKFTEIWFGTVFAVDIYLRIGLLGRYFWRSYFNWFDTVVVTIGILELMFIDLAINTTVLRLLRIVKLGRSVRLMRMSTSLESLHSMLRCIAASFHTLFWSMFLLVVIQCIFAMSLMYAVEPWMHDLSVDIGDRQKVYRYYGTFTRTMLTMFEVLFANWVPSCRILVDNVTEWFSLAFILYRCIVGFAVLNVVNAVFVQSTLKIAQQDSEHLIVVQQKAAEKMAERLNHVFTELDSSGDGSLSWDEFSVVLTDPRMKAMVASIEVDPHDLEILFRILDDGDGQIQMEEFTNGIRQIKGSAKALDVAQLLHISKRLEKKVESICKATSSQGPALAPILPQSPKLHARF